MRYRPDIDGLRAFAIIVVVLFHVGFEAVPGGFIGVDVFFVISGFLITGLITDHLRHGEFSFWEFYARRTRRIFPALLTMVSIVVAVGYFILTPAEYDALGKSAVYSSAFLANVYFWLHTGYFDKAADTMPLLHLWSIGIEEQFYLIWPLSVVLVWRQLRLSQRSTLRALIVATVLLAALCVLWSERDAKSAFFLPFTRLWEFTLGALLLALPPVAKPRLADGLSVLGILAMAFAALTFNTELAYPGYFTLVPCLGAAAVIAAGEGSVSGTVLSLRPNVALGKMSYSLYLWHWPIIVLGGFYLGREDLLPSQRFLLILTALAIAFLSWRFIELPARRRRGPPRHHVAWGATGAAAVAALSFLVVANAGFAWRLPTELGKLRSDDEMTAKFCAQEVLISGLGRRPICVIGAPWGSGAVLAILWGDSHAAHLTPLLDLAAKRQGLTVLFWKGCAPSIDDRTLRRKKQAVQGDYSSKCGKGRKTILDFVRANPSVRLVIIANAWPSYPKTVHDADGSPKDMDDATALRAIEKGLGETIAEIQPQNHTVLLVGDVPRPRFDVPDCVVQATLHLWRKPCNRDTNFLDRDATFEFHRPTESILANLASKQDHVYYLNLLRSMCGPKGCPLRINSEVLYADESHLRRNLSPNAKESLASLLRLDEALRLALDKAPSAEAAKAH